eukprot:m.96778 g.96778  ORF g.96778 m.96778 type:complete len:51 (+) comp12475_c2_seq1:524-676(+)
MEEELEETKIRKCTKDQKNENKPTNKQTNNKSSSMYFFVQMLNKTAPENG